MRMSVIENNVALLLKENPELRNDDRMLIFSYWNKFDNADIEIPNYPVTSPSTIRRMRQKLQSKGLFLPTNPDILKKRRKHKKKIEKWLQK